MFEGSWDSSVKGFPLKDSMRGLWWFRVKVYLAVHDAASLLCLEVQGLEFRGFRV